MLEMKAFLRKWWFWIVVTPWGWGLLVLYYGVDFVLHVLHLPHWHP